MRTSLDPRKNALILILRVLWIFILLFVSKRDVAATCGHGLLTSKEINHVFVDQFEHREKRGASVYEQLRIHLTYDNSKSVVSQAISYWEQALKTRRLSKSIKLARACSDLSRIFRDRDEISERQHYCDKTCAAQTQCGDVIIPEAHLQGCRYRQDTLSGTNNVFITEEDNNPGVSDADFLLYVAANSTPRCNISLAYASYCQLEVEYDRPIAGFINICPDRLSTHTTQLEIAVATVKHEILHALGFSLSLYGFYRDSEGNPFTVRERLGNLPPLKNNQYTYSDRVVKTITRNWKIKSISKNITSIQRDVNMMVTPKVVYEARKHFNCSTLEGAELEDQGPTGTKLTHWEKRVFENELMTGKYTQNPTISRITLAMMEDTGWYLANYEMAEPLEWGLNLGCEFVKESCFEWMYKRQQKNISPHPFCTTLREDPLKTECSTSRTAMVQCNLYNYPSDLLDKYQYVEDSRVGGLVDLADYCPYPQEFNWRKNGEFVRGSDCLLSTNVPVSDSNYAAESYGNESGCFDQLQPFQLSRCSQMFSAPTYGSGCYEYTCSEEEGLNILVEGVSHRCYYEGQEVTINVVSSHSLHNGVIRCPSCNEMCKGKVLHCPEEQSSPVEDVAEALPVPCSGSVIILDVSFYIMIFQSFYLQSVIA